MSFGRRVIFRFDKVDESKRYFTNYKKFRDDPVANPLKTPSGKIEIYSENGRWLWL